MPDHTLTKNNIRIPVQPKCAFSHIECKQDIMLFAGHNFPHAGTVAHRCQLDAKHEGWCECGCGFRWKGYTL